MNALTAPADMPATAKIHPFAQPGQASVPGAGIVTELWEDRRGALMIWISPVITGTKDRAKRNKETMTLTLDRLAAALESVSPAGR
jgi:hypothetical protein